MSAEPIASDVLWGVRARAPKALAAFSSKLAEAFEQATRETDRMKAKIEAASRAAVKLDEVDLSHVIQGAAKK